LIRILSSNVIYIPEKKLYSIPLDVLKMERQMVNSDRQKLTSVTTWKVKTIHPTITETGSNSTILPSIYNRYT
jgi:hypothetical protein